MAAQALAVVILINSIIRPKLCGIKASSGVGCVPNTQSFGFAKAKIRNPCMQLKLQKVELFEILAYTVNNYCFLIRKQFYLLRLLLY